MLVVPGSLLILIGMASVGVNLILEGLGCSSVCSGAFFVFDDVSLYLSLLSLFLLITLVFVYDSVTSRSLFFIVVSVLSSVLCYSSNHVFFFWWFYEVSIVSLLYLLMVESPYSERYVAGWYLAGYIVLTSLPMMLCLVYASVVLGSFFMSEWLLFSNWHYLVSLKYVLLVLGVLFVTKVPVFPFHAWLPIVHAEATSIVSVCLSGYVMKLGVLGVCRFCWWLLPDELFGVNYVVLSFFFSLFFFFAAFRELDGKRWLAFLSLAHIIVCVVCYYGGQYDSGFLLFVYSLGHGLSAGLVFLMLWWCYDLAGSRNWMILSSVTGGGIFFRVVVGLCLCTAASFPPVVQFFVEVIVLLSVGVLSLVIFSIFCLYLFFCSLVPFFLLGSMVIRQFCLQYSGSYWGCGLVASLIFMLFLSFIIFVVV